MTDENIGPRVKQLREQAALTQRQLAERSGLLQQTIGMIETAKIANPRLDVLRKLAAGLGVSVAELIGEENERLPSPQE